MRIAVVGLHNGVNESMSHFVKKNKDMIRGSIMGSVPSN
jgi:hypothetical protein